MLQFYAGCPSQFSLLIFHLKLALYRHNLKHIERRSAVMNEYTKNNKYFAKAKEFRLSIAPFFDSSLLAIGHTLMGGINTNFQDFYFAK